MPTIHPTAVVESGAQIGEGVTIGPFCYVGPKVRLGAGCRLVSHIAILGRTTLGQGNTLWPQATLGADPQDLKYHGEDSELIVGDHNEIRELVTMHLGTENGGGVTRVGNDNLIMAGAHIAHDCDIGSYVLIANNVGLSGHVKVEDHANIAGVVGVHHFVTVGQYSFTGGLSRVVHDVPPFMIVEGNPASVRGPNLIGLRRHGFTDEAIENLKDAYRRIFRRPAVAQALSLDAKIAALEETHPADECIRILAQSLRNSAAGVFGRHLESLRHDSRRKGYVPTPS